HDHLHPSRGHPAAPRRGNPVGRRHRRAAPARAGTAADRAGGPEQAMTGRENLEMVGRLFGLNRRCYSTGRCLAERSAVGTPAGIASPHRPSPNRPPRLIIRLISTTIRRDPSRSVWIDEPSNVSRLDPSGADQTDAEHQATELAVGVRIPRAIRGSTGVMARRGSVRVGVPVLAVAAATATPGSAAWSGRPRPA